MAQILTKKFLVCQSKLKNLFWSLNGAGMCEHTKEAHTGSPPSPKISEVVLKNATMDRYKETVDFVVKCFVNTEPTTIGLKFTEKDGYQFYEPLVKKCFKGENLSILAINSVDKVVGCGLASLYLLDPKLLVEVFEGLDHDKDAKLSLNVVYMRKFFNLVLEGSKSLKPLQSGIPLKCFEHTIVAADKDYRRFGLGQKVVAMGQEKAKALGCDYTAAVVIAYQSQELARNAGMEAIKVVNHKDFKGNDGLPLIKSPDPMTTCGKFMVRKLK